MNPSICAFVYLGACGRRIVVERSAIVATFITLLLVPVFYSILVLDLKLVKWDGPTEKQIG